jgi:hypothetical protein
VASFTLSIEQIQSAPATVREWVEQEVAAMLGPLPAIELEMLPAAIEEPTAAPADAGLQLFVFAVSEFPPELDEIVAWWRHRRIQERAYAIWEEAGRPAGGALEHWLRAEAELWPVGSPEHPSHQRPDAERFRYLARRIQSMAVPVSAADLESPFGEFLDRLLS